jgi:rRNA maturation protein Nop10
MAIRNCPECGRVFKFVFKDLCSECIEQDEAALIVIKDFLPDHPGAKVADIARETGLETRRVFRLLRDQRLTAVCEDNKIQLLSCERCQKPVLNDRFCPECREQLSKLFEQMLKEPDHGKKTAERERPGDGSFTGHFKR